MEKDVFSQMQYDGAEPYVFISYSHADRSRVKSLLGFLYQNGVRFWYDEGIYMGEEWREKIDGRLRDSKSFVLFMSNGVEQRPEVIRELKMAMKKRDADPEHYKILIVLLEYVAISHLFKNEPEIIALFEKLQYLSLPKYGGITTPFLRAFFNRHVFPDYLKDPQRSTGSLLQKKLAGLDGDTSLDNYNSLYDDNTYIYPLARPALCKVNDISFHAVRMGETDPNTVYPLCMDNQWCPPEVFSEPSFKAKGLLAEDIAQKRNHIQRLEIFRALLHNWQLLINRASVFNTEAYTRLYTSPDEKEAFGELLDNGSLVIYLMYEYDPCQIPEFGVKPEMKLWREFCRKHTPYCIKFDWEDADNEELERSKKLSTRFRELLLTTADDPFRIEILCDAMDIPADQRDAFRLVWQDIRKQVIQCNENVPINKISDYKRQRFYEQYIVKDGTPVPECIVDYDKPFSVELKQIVDFVYAINLPLALGVQPMINYDNPLRKYLFLERRGNEQLRVLSVDELYCSVISFMPDFIRQDMFVADAPTLDLDKVNRIRKLPEWHSYMEAVDAGRKRSGLNEIDFSDVAAVWTRYRALTEQCSRLFPEMNWRQTSGSVSFIYHFGEYMLICVYDAAANKLRIRRNTDNILSSRARENMTIDFVCGNIFETNIKENCFLIEQRLFDGLMLEQSGIAYEKILQALMEYDHEFVDGEERA